jgi:hypothetical protein
MRALVPSPLFIGEDILIRSYIYKYIYLYTYTYTYLNISIYIYTFISPGRCEDEGSRTVPPFNRRGYPHKVIEEGDEIGESFTGSYIYIYIHTYICIYTYIYIHMYKYIFINLYIYVYIGEE